MSRRKNRKPRKANNIIAIIVDGETEYWYLQKMRMHEQLRDVQIKPELPKKKKLKDQYDSILEKLEEGYYKVIWMLDFDTIAKEDREKPKGKPSILLDLKKYLNDLEKHGEKVQVLVNNPCLEFWYLLHFERTGRYFPQCSPVEKILKSKHLKGYNKSRKYYNNANKDIYKRLKPFQSTGIENAQILGDFDIEKPETAKAEMFKLFGILGVQ